MRSVKRNFIYNLFYQLLTFLLPLITTPYLSRVLGAEKTGIYSYSYSIAYYFVLFAMLGLNNYGNREIAKVRDDEFKRSYTFWSIYFLQIFTSVVIIVFYTLSTVILRNEFINWIMLLYVVSSFFDINWFFWGMEEFKITVIRNTVIKILSVMAILFLIKDSGDLYLYALIMVLGMFLSPICLWPYLKKYVIWVKPTFSSIKSHMKPNIILFIPVIAVSLYKVMDKIMLGSMATYLEVGLYDYAEKIIAIPVCCVNALGTVMMPRMANLVAKKENEIEKDIIFKSLIVGTILSTSMSFGLIGIANVFVPFFYGKGFKKCIILFYILLPSCIFLSIANVIRTQYLIPHSKDKEFTISLVIGAMANLLINALLIPHLQSIGAAVGTLIAEALVCFVQAFYIRKNLDLYKILKEIIPIIISGLVMSVVVYLIPFIENYVLTLLIKIFVGCIVFLGLILKKHKNVLFYLINKN